MTDDDGLIFASVIVGIPYPQRIPDGFMTDDRVCCENIAAAMFVTVKEMRAGPS